MSAFIGTWKRLRGFSSDLEVTKQGKAFAEIQRTGECFEEASFQALKSQLWSIHWTLCWPSDPQVKDVWMREEQVNDKCNWSETQVTLECPRWNVSARRVSRECPPRAGCRPKSHFYLNLKYMYIGNIYYTLDFRIAGNCQKELVGLLQGLPIAQSLSNTDHYWQILILRIHKVRQMRSFSRRKYLLCIVFWQI